MIHPPCVKTPAKHHTKTNSTVKWSGILLNYVSNFQCAVTAVISILQPNIQTIQNMDFYLYIFIYSLGALRVLRSVVMLLACSLEAAETCGIHVV